MTAIVSLIVATLAGCGFPIIDHVVDGDGVTHVACVDVGPTICADGTVFSDWDPDGPIVTYRSDIK